MPGRRGRAICGLVLALAVTAAEPTEAQTAADADKLSSEVLRLHQAGKYSEAIPIAERALALRETALGPQHPDVATALNSLAVLYQMKGRFAEAEPLNKRAVAIREKALGPQHPDVATPLSNLAELYQMQGRFAEAEPLNKRALAIRETALGPQHPLVARALNNLAALYMAQGRFAEAESHYKRGLAIREKVAGPDHAETAVALANLALLFKEEGRYAEAEPMMRRAIVIMENKLGPDDRNLGSALGNLASLYRAEGRYLEAEPLAKRSVAINEKALGQDNPVVAKGLSTLADLYQVQGRYAEAEPLHKRAVAIVEKAFGPNHPDVSVMLGNLAALYRDEGRYADAEPLLERALAIAEKSLGPNHPSVATKLGQLAQLYGEEGRYSEAEPLMKRALAVTEKALGAEHRDVGTRLINFGSLYRDQGRYADAERLYKRALAISEKALGPDHPDVGALVGNLALLFDDQGRTSEAEALLKRALAISEKALGADHPVVGSKLNNLAEHYGHTGRSAEAVPLIERSLAISEKALGPDHPHVGNRLLNLAVLYAAQGRAPEAKTAYLRALGIYERKLGPDHPHVGRLLNALGEFYKTQGQYAEAESVHQRSLRVREKVLGPDHPDIGVSLNNLAWLALAQRDWARAAEYWRRGATLLQRRAERGIGDSYGGKAEGEAQRNSWYFAGLIKATHRLAAGDQSDAKKADATKNEEEMFSTAQWARGSEAAASLAQMAARSAHGSPELAALVRERQDLLAEWQAKDKMRTAASSRMPQQRDAASEKQVLDRLAAIDARLAMIDGRLATDFPDYAALASPKPVSLVDVQSALRVDEALLLFLDTNANFYPLPEETFIWVVTKTKMRWLRSELGSEALQQEVTALRCGLDYSGAWLTKGSRCRELTGGNYTAADDKAGKPLPFDIARAHALYKRLLGGAEDLIKDKHLIVVPSGPLTKLPLQVLITSLPEGSSLVETSRDVGRLGAELTALTDEERKKLPADAIGGVRIVKPVAGGPAEAAGLRAGDVLFGVDQQGFASVPDAVTAVQAAGAGRNVKLELIREGQRISVAATLGSTTLKGIKPIFLGASNIGQLAWVARANRITVLPAVSSLKALRRDAKASTAKKPYLGLGDPLLDGPDASYAKLKAAALASAECGAQPVVDVADLRGFSGVSSLALRGGVANVAALRTAVPLPETAMELCDVAKAVGGAADVLLGARATETDVKRMSAEGKLRDYRIVHFATHGAMAGEVSTEAEAGLLLTPPATGSEEDDGYLSASEIAGLKLDADWVILSACNTAAAGARNAEALSGLARAFFYGGARSLLVSHWYVDSAATVALIQGAFAELKAHPEIGRSEAMRRSMLALIDEDAQPASWAPFVVVGEGAVTK